VPSGGISRTAIPRIPEADVTPEGISEETDVPRSRIHAVVTDVHFWIPVVVLVLGAMLLLVLR
jgi:hypothetical protein